MDASRRSDLAAKVASLMLENEWLRERYLNSIEEHMDTLRQCLELRDALIAKEEERRMSSRNRRRGQVESERRAALVAGASMLALIAVVWAALAYAGSMI